MMEKVYIGVDVGGMSIKAGAVNEKGGIIFKETAKTDAKDVDKFLNDIRLLVKKTITIAEEKGLKVEGIGFGVPGVVNNVNGTIDKMANIDGRFLPLRDTLKEFNLPVLISNDANVAALAEQKFGVAKGYKDVILLTLGTGVGGGVIVDGKLIEGNMGKGAELGHVVIVLNGEPCGCGRKGCYEAYASASALLRLTKEIMNKNKDSMMWEYCENDINKVSGLTSFECAKKGDKAANEVVDTYIMYLGEGMLNFCNIFRPEVFVMGGGISNQGEYLTSKLQKYLEDHEYGYATAPASKVLIAKFKNDAGIIGAASLFLS